LVVLPILPVLARLARLPLLTAPILEEFLKELLERRTRRQLWHGATASEINGLLGRDVDHGVYDLFGHISYPLRPASRRWRCKRRPGNGCGG
jgi:hypothetical protein